MANLLKSNHKLNSSQRKFEKYSKFSKQFQLKFERQSGCGSRFYTRISIVRGEKNYKYSNKGLIHRLVNQKSRIIGDKPSVTKTLKAIQPETVKGHITKKTAQAVNFLAHDISQTAVDTALFSETVGIKVFDESKKTVCRKYIQKYKNEAFDDYHKGVIKLGGTTADAVKGTYNHFKQKKQFKLEKARYKLNKNQIRQFKIDKKYQRKINQKQWRITDLSRPAPLVLKPVGYTSKQMTASSWQKAVNEDDSNDFMKIVDEVKRHGFEKAVQRINPNKLKEKNQKKKSKLEDKKLKKHQKLKKQENKLKNRNSDTSSPFHRKNSEIKKNMLAEFLKKLKNMYESEAAEFLLIILVSILIILLVLAFIIMIFSGIAGNSGFILGTFSAQDYDLSEAEKYYTKLAWNMNQNILMVGDLSDWKNGLKNLNADTSKMKDNPDKRYWGKSVKYNYEPKYDFDTYKLWSFLCAYYYDFDSTNNEDVNYWKFNSDTEKLIKELFDDEYQFVYTYDNTSRWEYKYNFDSRGYYSIEGSGTSGSYGYIDIVSPSALPMGDVTNEKTLYFELSNGEVLNYNDGYSKTGWYLKNQYVDDYDNNGTKYAAWYTDGKKCRYGIWDNDMLLIPIPYVITENNKCSFLKKYEWKTDCRLYYSIKQKKTFDKVIEDKLKSMSHKDERIQYYKLLLGEDSGQMYGNHQTLKNMFGTQSIHDFSVTNGFGYDMQNWNSNHCKIDKLHEGIDVKLNTNSKIYAPFDCKITKVDTSNHSIILRKNDVEYRYDGNGGTKRDTEVYLTNVKLKSGLSEGDSIKIGDYFANSTDDKNCDNLIFDNSTTNYVHIKVKIDTDGFGWDFIDPRLVLY